MPSDDELSLSSASVLSTADQATVSYDVGRHTRHFSQNRPFASQPKPRTQIQSTLSDRFLQTSNAYANLVAFPVGAQKTIQPDDPPGLTSSEESGLRLKDPQSSQGIGDRRHDDDTPAESDLPASVSTILPSLPAAAKTHRSIHNKKRPSTSDIFQYCERVSKDDRQLFECNLCKKLYAVIGSPFGFRAHLQKDHNINSKDDSKRQKRFPNTEGALMRQNESVNDVRMSQCHSMLAGTANKTVLEHLYLKWIVNAEISLFQVEHQDFRAFLHYANSIANEQLPTSHKTIRQRVIALYAEG